MSNLYGGQDLSGLGKGDKTYPPFAIADESKLREYIELSNQVPILGCVWLSQTRLKFSKAEGIY